MDDGAPTAGRISTGLPWLDDLLGGGLLPGTLTVAAGATGVGKTQLGLHFAQAGAAAEGRRGVFFDMTARGDAQGHGAYAERMFGWPLVEVDPNRKPNLAEFFQGSTRRGDYLRVFGAAGRRISRGDVDWDAWRLWQAELQSKLAVTIAFLYGAMVDGARRVVVDGLEPVGRSSESIQIQLFDYLYDQILRKDAEWVARDLFREHYRAAAEQIAAHAYDPAQTACLLLYTTEEVMLERMIEEPIREGDLLSGANTILYLGKLRRDDRLGRGLYVAKHRGSACEERIVEFTIDDAGLRPRK